MTLIHGFRLLHSQVIAEPGTDTHGTTALCWDPVSANRRVFRRFVFVYLTPMVFVQCERQLGNRSQSNYISSLFSHISH